MAAEALENTLPPVRLDVTELPRQAGPAAAVVCLTTIHIVPWFFRGTITCGAAPVAELGRRHNHLQSFPSRNERGAALVRWTERYVATLRERRPCVTAPLR